MTSTASSLSRYAGVRSRRLRANRLMFHPVLWPTPPPTPKDIPPLWMNAPNPSLSDPLQAYQRCRGHGRHRRRRGPLQGLAFSASLDQGFGYHRFEAVSERKRQARHVLADAISSLRKDVAKPMGDVPAVFTVDKGAHTAQVMLRWRPELKPKPQSICRRRGRIQWLGVRPIAALETSICGL